MYKSLKTMNKTERIQNYLYEFFSTRFEHLDFIYRSTHQNRVTDIYTLNNGPELMDFLISIHGNVEDSLFAKQLIPQKFATPQLLINSLIRFRSFLNDHQELLDSNNTVAQAYYVVEELQRIKNEYLSMLNYALSIFDYEEPSIPYQELRYSLITGNFEHFVELLKSLIASVPYAISKSSEGHFHVIVHVILKLLGFDVLSEELTNKGRIDAVLRLSDKICILEFKFDETGDKSQEALEQIIDKDYAAKFKIEGLQIYGIGISFNSVKKNIVGYEARKLD